MASRQCSRIKECRFAHSKLTDWSQLPTPIPSNFALQRNVYRFIRASDQGHLTPANVFQSFSCRRMHTISEERRQITSSEQKAVGISSRGRWGRLRWNLASPPPQSRPVHFSPRLYFPSFPLTGWMAKAALDKLPISLFKLVVFWVSLCMVLASPSVYSCSVVGRCSTHHPDIEIRDCKTLRECVSPLQDVTMGVNGKELGSPGNEVRVTERIMGRQQETWRTQMTKLTMDCVGTQRRCHQLQEFIMGQNVDENLPNPR